ncbi:MAG TPA: 50S ribosomal protein L11 methyltransferase [Povalibacter sp.]|uniref:50S ribosomal protein L11 methyltransferase n=1 Tax=Povalibacter sp. TaxID=1962978 RepID=UPI002CDD2AB5|nr:50S ribosomal protein L11 methyltransferase [Povalibacter sp.]HMN45762.1 50S ribosomal protein L11 methyltransferase [Povalibacter sp.]
MPFLQLTFPVGSADPEPFEDALLAAGAVSLTLEDAADNPVLEPAPGTTPLWPSVRIKALFDAGADPLVIEALLRSQLGARLPALQFETLDDRPWEREWLKDFRPMRFGRRLWICPAGMRPEQLETAPTLPSPASGGGEERAPLAPVFLDLDPGLAFGTGTHPTTALCLTWLDGAELRDRTVIDYGCGSGILAIAALKLGARSALGVDIDPQAVIATRDNAARNEVAERLAVCTVAEMAAEPADVVLANILAEPLTTLAATLASLVKPGGRIVLSGLLTEQAERVATHYTPWFDIAPVSVHDGWARIDGIRKDRAC